MFRKANESILLGGEQNHFFRPAAEVYSQHGKDVYKFQNEITIAGSIHAVCRGSVKAKLVSHDAAIQRQGSTCNRARSQWGEIKSLAAINEAFGVSQKHLDIGEQPMPDQYGLARCKWVYAGMAELPALSAWSRKA